MNDLNWQGIQEFLAVAKAGSLSAAARQLGVSQPTVGRRIEALEAKLDAPLFIRTPQGLNITETGEKVLDHAELMSDEAHAIERIVSGRQTGLTGTVTIASLEGLGAGWLAAQFEDFYARYPDINLQLTMQLHAVDLLRREADIAVRLFRPTQLDLIARKVGDIGFGFYASPGYIKRKGELKSIADLERHDVVLPDAEVTRYVEATLHKKSVRMGRVTFRSNNMMALQVASAKGYGIGIHTCIVADQDPGLVRMLPGENLIEQEVWLVTHKELRRSARIRAVFDFLSELFEENRGALLGRPPDGAQSAPKAAKIPA